jgi:hypothetical protein
MVFLRKATHKQTKQTNLKQTENVFNERMLS